MKLIRNYNDFMYNQLLEGMKLKISKGELILSKKLKDILLKMKHQIADDLVAIHKSPEAGPDYKKSFLDVGEKPSEISYIMVNKVPELLDDEEVWTKYVHNPDSVQPTEENPEGNFTGGYFETGAFKKPSKEDPDYDEKDYVFSDTAYFPDLHDIQFTRKNHPVWTKNRFSQEARRLINDLFPGKYPLNYSRKDRFSVESEKGKLDDLESFQMMYTAVVEENSKKIDVVSGDDIKHWYSNEHYLETKGTLGGSCMSDPKKNKYMSFYALNPEKVSMLILFPEGRRDVIIGRALLWNIDEIDGNPVKDIKYMDRIYTINQGDEELFINYAKKNRFYYKSSQSYGDYPIVTPSGQQNIKLSVFINDIDYEYYPYVDTLTYYNRKTHEITNKTVSGNEYGTMTSQGGGVSW